jgi:hypothetical protein
MVESGRTTKANLKEKGSTIAKGSALSSEVPEGNTMGTQIIVLVKRQKAGP